MNNGYIKLHRRFKDSLIFGESQAVHLWVYLLLSVNHKDKDVLMSGTKINIKAGSFISSRKTVSLNTGINESKIQRLLKILESEQMIEQQMNSKYRIISISNWQKYQTGEQVNEQQVNSKRTAGEQQVNTNKNEENELKNDKNVKNKEKVSKDTKKKLIPKKPDDISQQLWDEWFLIKKQKNQTMTISAFEKFKELAKEFSLSTQELIEYCIDRSWASATKSYLTSSGLKPKNGSVNVDNLFGDEDE